MDRALVDQVRSFNRTVTQQVGALAETYLARGRPLGQARLLWEIGAGDAGSEPDGNAPDGPGTGVRVRELRERLGLDSGYVSRLLRALEADGLVTVLADPRD